MTHGAIHSGIVEVEWVADVQSEFIEATKDSGYGPHFMCTDFNTLDPHLTGGEEGEEKESLTIEQLRKIRIK